MCSTNDLASLFSALQQDLAESLEGSWSTEGVMSGQPDLLRTEDGLEVYLELDIDDDFGCPCVRLIDIETLSGPGTGIGTLALGVIRRFCDDHALPLIVETAVSTWWQKPENHWLAHAGYDFFGLPWLLYRQDDWPAPALDLDTERGAMACTAGVELDPD